MVVWKAKIGKAPMDGGNGCRLWPVLAVGILRLRMTVFQTIMLRSG
jgi:hypothetical protein